MAKRWWLELLGFAAISLIAMSVPAVAAPRAWHSAGSIDGAELTGMACPSASLCVAVDAAGHALTSSSPTTARSWHAVRVDARTSSPVSRVPPSRYALPLIARATSSSTAPTGGAAAWTAANVAGGQPLTGISCASTTICAAITTSVLVSSNPGGGSGAWSDTGVGEGSYYETLHYGGPPAHPYRNLLRRGPAHVRRRERRRWHLRIPGSDRWSVNLDGDRTEFRRGLRRGLYCRRPLCHGLSGRGFGWSRQLFGFWLRDRRDRRLASV